ncbi:MAG TPA: M4 family metallopeptidase [Candidatus Dormibacteraeota bacterium]|nr:M4 family metallopeptidase [Candidatus Dormibacteraeota bacterium]
MSRTTPHLCRFVPPFVLERIALEGTREQREWAIRTLAIDHSIRAVRLQHGTRLGPAGLLAATPGQVDRTIADAQHGNDPGAAVVVRREGQPPTRDAAVDEAYDGFGATHALYWEVYRRDSIDGQGMPLLGVVHYGREFDNAFWDGERMIFGDGDGQTLRHFTGAVDVIGHELTHGVTQHTCNLDYVGQPGALNESISDVFGSLVKQRLRGQDVNAADWLVGDGVLGPALKGQALRSLAEPGTAFEYDSQPSRMTAFVHTDQDNGGVHINSGIPNHAFYLAAMEIGGRAWEAAGQIWYETLLDPGLGPGARFHQFAVATVHAAERLHGAGAAETRAVRSAWLEVGITA